MLPALVGMDGSLLCETSLKMNWLASLPWS